MRCQDVDNLLPGWASDELTPEERVSVSSHLETCETCQLALTEVEEALMLLEASEPLTPPVDLLAKTNELLKQERSKKVGWEERWELFLHKLHNVRITPVTGALAMASGFILFMSLVNINPRPSSAQSCHRNVRNLGRAVTEYQHDHQDKLPETLQDLIPDYLITIPPCSAAGRDTYTEGYDRNLKEDRAFEITCSGHYHASEGLGPNTPRWTAK